jgi:ADP-heptose:LPS heptosyltransferase
MKKNKVLIIRFSSFGDIVQCSSVVDLLAQKYDGPVDWVTRGEFSALVALNERVERVWTLQKKDGFTGLVKLALKLRAENYEYVYDAHNNLRSKVLSLFLRSKFTKAPNWLTRPKDRFKRILLFSFRINKFPWPFIGINSYIDPLRNWGIKKINSNNLNVPAVHWNFSETTDSEKVRAFQAASNSIILVPSAAWEMKRWPLNHWKQLITLMPENQFIVLGGKEDTFCEELKVVAPNNVMNLAGKLSLIESCALIKESKLVISADTGLLHVADVLGKRGIALIGPTAFGFTKSPLIETMQVDLPCRPCTKDGRGNCSQDVYQKCMVDITPAKVAKTARNIIRE